MSLLFSAPLAPLLQGSRASVPKCQPPCTPRLRGRPVRCSDGTPRSARGPGVVTSELRKRGPLSPGGQGRPVRRNDSRHSEVVFGRGGLDPLFPGSFLRRAFSGVSRNPDAGAQRRRVRRLRRTGGGSIFSHFLLKISLRRKKNYAGMAFFGEICQLTTPRQCKKNACKYLDPNQVSVAAF